MSNINKNFHPIIDVDLALKGYYEDFNSDFSELKSESIYNGHIVVFFLEKKFSTQSSSKEMKLGKYSCAKLFHELLINSVRTSATIENLKPISTFHGVCLSALNKYEYMFKSNKNATFYLEFFEKILDVFNESKENIKRKSSCVPILKETSPENSSESDIYERYFDLSSQDMDAEDKYSALSCLMEDAMSKLHDSELQIHKLKACVSELNNHLDKKDSELDNLKTKLKNDSQRGNIVVKLSKQMTIKDDQISKLNFENKQMTDLLAKRNDYITELEEKIGSTNEELPVPDSLKTSAKTRGKKRKDSLQDSTEVFTPAVTKHHASDNEIKINKLVKERHSPKISELLLELFPDISISDFEVILKILTDSDVLLGHRIMHRWNVSGKDINYYGTIKENLPNQNKFYITYGELKQEESDTDFEVVNYSIIIADIISKDLTFLDPGSLF